MMKRSSGDVVENSPVQQMMAGNPNCNWWSVVNTRPHHHQLQQQQPSSPNNYNFFSSSSSNFLPPPPSSSLPLPSWHHQDLPPHSWTQLLMGGCQLEEGNINNNKKLMSWEDEGIEHQVDPIKQETTSLNNYGYANTSDEFQATKPPSSASVWPHPILPSPPPNSSPKSTITSFNTNINNLLDFTTTPLPDPSPQCNSGGASKKARVQASTTTQSQSSFKVRKEKLGDRITTLHQLVSPFGKTDTASVLLEAIGYIRFLQSQIEALSIPYLGNASPNMRQQVQRPVQGENNCIFPEDPGQLLNENCLKRKAAGNKMQDSKEDGKKDLRSRGLCLVPVSCTMQVGSENGADYWAPALGGGFR